MKRRNTVLSKKDVENYFNTVNAQYHEFTEELKDFEDLCRQHIVDPDVVQSAKKQFLVVKDNWERLNYVMYLLNRPVKKAKHKTYDRQSSKLLANCVTSEEVIIQNSKAKEEFQQIIAE